jgi:hypothetical protein
MLSPMNSIYAVNNATFTFNVSIPELNNTPRLFEIYYKRDWKETNAYVYKHRVGSGTRITEFFYNTTLTGIPEGKHSIVINVTAYGGYAEGLTLYSFEIRVSSSVNFTIDTALPMVSVLSVKNKTYDTTDFPLNFTVNEPSSQVTYSLDGQKNVAIAGNTTLTNLPYGEHNITVYATDEAGNTGAFETIYFSADAPTPELFSSNTCRSCFWNVADCCWHRSNSLLQETQKLSRECLFTFSF